MICECIARAAFACCPVSDAKEGEHLCVVHQARAETLDLLHGSDCAEGDLPKALRIPANLNSLASSHPKGPLTVGAACAHDTTATCTATVQCRSVDTR